ncbi:serine/threonine protein kinase, partial [Myxococcota bacterium]|nr:serine/threonine protein kinase [Myxococcota bacterium]
MVEAWAPIATLAQFEATLSRTFDLSGLAGRDGNESTLVPRISHADTDVRALVAALPRLVTRSDGQAADLVFDRTLGEGGMGIVRLAEQRALGREVAVKSLRADRATPEAALRLVREAWITGRLEHPNIVPVYTLGVDADGQPMIVMKRIEGTLWSDYLRGRAEPQTPAERRLEWHLRVLMQVANAVELAASKGIVHRDLKPDNVMIGRFGEVYVLDWGIAVSLDDRAAGRLPLASAAHGIAGTPAYMAPEMVEEDAARLGPRTDVYLLGATLHEVLVGAPRHGGRSIVECLFSSHHSAPFDYPAHVPVELAAIANRAMRRLPADRFESAEVFRRALEDFLSHETARALAAEATSRLAELERLLGDAERAAPRDPADAAIRAPDVPEVALYEVFGGCRFGFMQALRAWPDSPGARPGLERALR